MKTMSPMKTAADPLQPQAQTAANSHQLAQCLVLVLRCSATRTAMGVRRTNGSLLGWRESLIHPCHGVSSLDSAPFSIFLALHSALCLSLDSKFHTLNQTQFQQPQPFLNGLPPYSSRVWGLTYPLVCSQGRWNWFQSTRHHLQQFHNTPSQEWAGILSSYLATDSFYHPHSHLRC